MSLGFRVLQRSRCVSPQVVESFRTLPVANVGDCMNRMFAAGPRIRPIWSGHPNIAGPALTVRSRPGDNLMLHHALDIAEAGDVIVVDAGGDLTTAIMGEIMAAIALRRKVEAIVINGAIRDAAEIAQLGLPLYAAGITFRGPYKNGPGEINTVISLDGMPIAPGDLVIADGDGVLCVPYEETERVLKAAREKHAAEQEELRQIAEGTNDRSWVMETLTKNGCGFA